MISGLVRSPVRSAKVCSFFVGSCCRSIPAIFVQYRLGGERTQDGWNHGEFPVVRHAQDKSLCRGFLTYVATTGLNPRLHQSAKIKISRYFGGFFFPTIPTDTMPPSPCAP